MVFKAAFVYRFLMSKLELHLVIFSYVESALFTQCQFIEIVRKVYSTAIKSNLQFHTHFSNRLPNPSLSALLFFHKSSSFCVARSEEKAGGKRHDWSNSNKP